MVALLWLIAINIWTVFWFWHDKVRAIAGGRRVAEADLLTLALIGGSPGALAARLLFRHKTRKEPFSTYLMLIVAGQIGVGVALLFF
ncbi:MAG: DUF1294 domain-containing protein [Pseudomonadota bacterium]